MTESTDNTTNQANPQTIAVDPAQEGADTTVGGDAENPDTKAAPTPEQQALTDAADLAAAGVEITAKATDKLAVEVTIKTNTDTSGADEVAAKAADATLTSAETAIAPKADEPAPVATKANKSTEHAKLEQELSDIVKLVEHFFAKIGDASHSSLNNAKARLKESEDWAKVHIKELEV